ncbi:granulysin isoform X1 [Ursus maritimus]|uniref:Granulysin isoform X1 n=1 Tax=Ursus maritimus TaxID=29073 RepID=A0A384CU07_URSMA|nr:granulysin isoform X1 [Ursus maritimus]
MSGDLGSGGSAEGGADPWSGQSCSAGDLWAPLLCLGTDFRECPEMVERWAHECGKRSVHGFHSTVRGNSSPEKEAIKQAASKLCRKTLMPKMLCDDIIGRYLSAITQGILNDKSPQEICVKMRMCRAKIGLGAPGALADPGEKHRIFSDHRQLLPS